MNNILIEVHYLPTINYFSLLKQANTIIIEQHEHYQKRSYRNRTPILSANGLLYLSIPLAKGKNQQQPIREVRIATHTDWQRQHWQSIRSAYGKAPFFEHYADYLLPFFERKTFHFLFDWNVELLLLLFKCLKYEPKIMFSDLYQPPTPNGQEDCRNKIRPNTDCTHLTRYPQVFEDKHGFIANASIVDLLFCAGNEAKYIL